MSETRILFVDDEPMVLKGLQRTLRKMRIEWEMTFTSSAREALGILDQRPIDVIVSDLKMPEMDGIELSRQIRSDPELGRVPDVWRVPVPAGEPALLVRLDDLDLGLEPILVG